MSEYDDMLTDIRERTAFRLAGDADLACPDAVDSHGAVWLGHVRDRFLEAVDYAEVGDLDTVNEALSEIADGSVDIYTHTRWQVFTDLCLYQVDIADHASQSGEVDLTSLAGLAQYEAAWALGNALLTELRKALEESEKCSQCDALLGDADEHGMCASCLHDALRSGWEPGDSE